MFKIESYITPLLMGYLDKYVRLRPDDFQLSLWGGDAVLYNLDLRLDVIEKAMQLPIVFQSGHIHELRLHVPWTKLGSEPVIVTINTIECILKLRDTAYSDKGSQAGSDISARKSSSAQRQRTRRQDMEDLPPGYLQSLMNKIVNNVSIIVNNLIIKFVEEDIVLSLNMKSAECYSVDKDWNRAFVELSAPDYVLRRAINFFDLTICLDKRDGSGRIEHYQEPLAYRCSLSGRLYTKYDNIHAKYPTETKIDFYCERLDLSLTDTQLPMFIRLIELFMALYYGTMELKNIQDSNNSEPDSQVIPGESSAVSVGEPPHGDDEDQQGWASWAWSYVPQLMVDEDEEDPGYVGPGRRRKPPSSVFSLGMYAYKMTVTFKLTEHIREKLHYGPKKVSFKPFLYMEAEGVGVDVLMQGILFFNAQFGITNLQIYSQGGCICGVDGEENARNNLLLSGGDSLPNKTTTNYMCQSLFDPQSSENLGIPSERILYCDQHKQVFTEQYGVQKFGMFWMDYLYVFTQAEDRHAHSSTSSVSSVDNSELFLHENSLIRFVIGQCHLNVASTTVHRIQKFLHCAYNCEYEPYAKQQVERVDENRPQPTVEQLQSLEEFIPTQTYHVTLLQPIISILSAEHEHCDVAKKTFRSRGKGHKDRSGGHSTTLYPLFGIQLSSQRFDLQLTSPMYPRKLVQMVSTIAGPSSSLLHHCHTHTQMKLFGFHVGLTKVDVDGVRSPIQSIMPPTSGAMYTSRLLLPMYWKNSYLPKVERMYELPQVCLSVSKAGILVIMELVSSWLKQSPKPADIAASSLMDDVFPANDDEGGNMPVLELSVTGFEMKTCRNDIVLAYSGTVSSIQTQVHGKEDGKMSVTPIFYGPTSTDSLHTPDWLLPDSGPLLKDNNDCFTFTYQVPQKSDHVEAPAVVLVNMEGVACCLDPVLLRWLAYTPTQRVVLSKDKKVELDMELALAASPLQANISQISQPSSGSTHRHTESLTYTRSPTTEPPSTIPAQQTAGDTRPPEGPKGWGEKMADMFPLIRLIQVQVEVKKICVFLSHTHIPSSDTSLSIPQTLQKLARSRSLPDLIVVCLPHVTVQSAGLKPVSFLQEIPITSMEGSLVGDKIPWNVSMYNSSIYTVHGCTSGGPQLPRFLPLVKPVTVTSTVGLSYKYTPLTSDNITALGLCLHTDMHAITVATSHDQIKLVIEIAGECVKLVTSCTSMVGELMKPLAAPDRKVSGPTLKPPSVPTLPRKPAASTTSLTEAEAMFTETSDITSLDTTPSRELEIMEDVVMGVKLSLWLQWTLPRCEMRLYTGGPDSVKISLVLEDIATSVDVQDVYAKVKMNVGSVNVHHYCRTRDSTAWEKGPYEGIVMSCQGNLSHDTHILTTKLWSSDQQRSAPASTRFSSSSQTREKTHGFLGLTFTRALRKNVKKRFQKLNLDMPSVNELGSDHSMAQFYFHKYVSEICVNLSPVDVVFCSTAIQKVLESVTNFDGPKQHVSTNRKSGSSSKGEKLVPPMFTSSNLPLIYADFSCFRLFIPADVSQDPRPKFSLDKMATTAHSDMCVIQVQSCSIAPQADNPLPRYPVDQALYQRAAQLGVTSQPGSALLDRQFQVDLKGFSIATGCWSRFVEKTKSAQKTSSKPGTQIPAYEWNVLQSFERHIDEEIKLFPLVSPCELKLVVAPAIVNVGPAFGSSQMEHTLVCGYALEFNVTSDLDLHSSTNQVHLLEQITSQTINNLSGSPGDEVAANDIVSVHGKDSGIGSEKSVMTTDRSKVKSRSHPVIIEPNNKVATMTPFDVLLTAGRISCTLYTHDVADSEIKLPTDKRVRGKTKTKVTKHDLEWQVDPRRCSTGNEDYVIPSPVESQDLKFMNIHKEFAYDSVMNVIPAGSTTIQPFMYFYISQPHLLVACHRQSQKFEMSCYDILIKGPGNSAIVQASEHRLLPECSDFSVYWLETRAGQSNPATGIPPCLYTLRATDFLLEPACISLKVERPIQVTVGFTKLRQVQTFIVRLWPPTPDSHATPPDSGRQPGVDSHSSTPALLNKVKHVEFVTDQVVFVMETKSCDLSPAVTASFSSLRMETELEQNDKGVVDTISSSTYARDIFVKTSYNDSTLPLIGPCSMKIDGSHSNCHIDNKHMLSQSIIAMATGLVLINVGQEHVLCLNLITEHVADLLKELYPVEPDEPKPDSSIQQVVPAPLSGVGDSFIVHTSTDDLRTGRFQYIMDTDTSGMLPSPGEIVFCDRDKEGNSTMAWSYSMPRVIFHVRSTPIPFGVKNEEAEGSTVMCSLQFWEPVVHQFLDYADLPLSEDAPAEAVLPDVHTTHCRDLAVAQTWRIVVLQAYILPHDGELVVLPTSLAAAVRVDSHFIPSLVPSVQLGCTMESLEVHLSNDIQTGSTEVPSKLKPFYFSNCFPASQEVSVLTMDNVMVAGSHLTGKHAKSHIQFSTHLSLDVLEYMALTMQRVIGPSVLSGSVSIQTKSKPPMIDVDISCDPITVKVGRSLVHTVTSSLRAWHQALCGAGEDDCVVFGQYVVCNDTQQAIRFGQVGTDENLVLQPREMHQYSWRSHKGKQQMHACLDGHSWKWCDPLDIHSPGVLVRMVVSNEQQYTFIIDVRRLSNTQYQVIFTGQLHVYNRLSQHIEVKVVTMDTGEEQGRAIVGAGQRVPSYIVDGRDVEYVKFRPWGGSATWSKEVHVSGEKMKESRLIKFILSDKTTFHVWCRIFTQHLKAAQQIFVVLCPLYIVRSQLPRPLYVNIDTSKLNHRRQIETTGRGSELQLVCAGGDIHHAVTFQFSSNSRQSSTAVTLSTGLIDQLKRTPCTGRDMSSMLDDSKDEISSVWPYCIDSDGSSPTSRCGNQSKSHTLPTSVSEQPTIDLNVTLTERWPGCGTVMVDVTPWCLLNNQCDLDLLIMGPEDSTYEVHKSQTISPPKLEGSFHVGVRLDDSGVCMSAAIPISDEEVNAQRYRRDIGKTLYLDSHVYMAVFTTRGSQKQVYFLTVTSAVKHQMRIITVRERFTFTNCTHYQLALSPFTVPLWSDKVDPAMDTEVVLDSHHSGKAPDLSPLPFHSLLHSDEPTLAQEIDHTTDFLHYLSVCDRAIQTNTATTDSEQCLTASNWSYPVRLTANENGCRMTVSVPLAKGKIRCLPLCITGQEKNGISHFVIRDDSAPVCLLVNHCSFPILFGETSMNLSLTGPVTQEEEERVTTLPTVPANGGQVYYTPPYLNYTFPAISDNRSHRNIQISALGEGVGDICTSVIHWSQPLDLQVATDTFVAIPGIADVRVHVTRVAMVIHMDIEPISKAEVSAKEIRSRLKGKERTIVIESKEVEKSVADMKSELKEVIEMKKEKSKILKINQKSELSYQYSVGLFVKQLFLVITDELSSPDSHSELLRFTAHDALLAYYPASALTDPQSYRRNCIVVSAGDVQLDNQIYSQGQYDFPVVVVRQDFNKPPTANNTMDYSEMNILEKHAILKSSSLVHVQIVVGTSSDRNLFIQSVEVNTKPISCYVDDTFVFRVIKEIEGFIPIPLSDPKPQSFIGPTLPLSVKNRSIILSSPIRIGHLSIHQVSLLFSVHASMKLFIACDNTPLTFGKFDRSNLCTSSQELTRDLVMHYASGALFRAGAVVGSLEILGSPTGLVRSIGTGVADFFRMPYRGLTRGPGAFVLGISRGTSSMVKNITTGMLTSITNFASSLSRNMDCLSLDSSHQARQEEGRRHRPDGVSEGLKQGLTGLGLSVLGAIAGIADQPLQNIVAQQADSDRASSKRSTASSLVTGVGKGLLGAVTKPIGGAAEFVSQTGQGILQGTGLSNFPVQRSLSGISPLSEMPCGQVKYAMKLLQHLPASDILYCAEAGFVDLNATLTPVTLIVTPEVMFVMNHEEDSQQQAFSLLELDCGVKLGSPSLLTIIWRDSLSYRDEDPGPTSEERVAAFIDGTINFGLPRPGQLTPPITVSNSDVKQTPTTLPDLSPIQELPNTAMTTATTLPKAAPLQNTTYQGTPLQDTTYQGRQLHDTTYQGTPLQDTTYQERQLSSVIPGPQISDSNSDSSSSVIGGSSVMLPEYDFQMAAPKLATFLAVFNITKQKLLGTGFAV